MLTRGKQCARQDKTVLMDGTFGTNKWKFHLTTLMVVDDNNHGVPVGWILHSNASAQTLKKALDALADNVGMENRPAVVVMDDAIGEIKAVEASKWCVSGTLTDVGRRALAARAGTRNAANSFTASMHALTGPCAARAHRGQAGTRIFLCVWHVKGAWLKNLRKKVKDWADRQTLLRECSTVLEMTDVPAARAALTKLLQDWVRHVCSSRKLFGAH
jgi:hypothetical protein